jgi:hypothetical protein
MELRLIPIEPWQSPVHFKRIKAIYENCTCLPSVQYCIRIIHKIIGRAPEDDDGATIDPDRALVKPGSFQKNQGNLRELHLSSFCPVLHKDYS